MKIGKLEIKGYSKMSYNNLPLKTPHRIIWGLIWSVPFYAAIATLYICVLVTDGKDAADYYIGNL